MMTPEEELRARALLAMRQVRALMQALEDIFATTEEIIQESRRLTKEKEPRDH